MQISKASLVAAKYGNYTIYVFKEIGTNKFIMCTKPPNWNTPNISVGDIGYVRYEEVTAGKEYYNQNLDQNDKYKYSAVYFRDFILDNNITVKEITL